MNLNTLIKNCNKKLKVLMIPENVHEPFKTEPFKNVRITITRQNFTDSEDTDFFPCPLKQETAVKTPPLLSATSKSRKIILTL